MAEGFLPAARKALGHALEAAGQSLKAPTVQEPEEYVKLLRAEAEPSAGSEADEWADVVFVHGLKGSAKTTWSSTPLVNHATWPAWVAATLPGVRVWCADYSSSLVPAQAHMAICDIGANLLHQLRNQRVGADRPVIFVGHSMGGLVIKEIVQRAALTDYLPDQPLWGNTAAIAFLATPHFGSSLASPAAWLANLFSVLDPGAGRIDSNAAELKPFSHHLAQTHETFKHHVARRGSQSLPVAIVAYAETLDTPPVGTVVPTASADPQMNSVEVVKLPGTHHLSICKPDDPGFVPHQWLVARLEALRGATGLATAATPCRVFIAHADGIAGADALDHSVDCLAMRLGQAGVQVASGLDRYRFASDLGWRQWLAQRFAEAELVVVVGSPALRQALGAGETASGTAGVLTPQQWDADAQARRLRRYVPVIALGATLKQVLPDPIAERWAYLRLPLDAQAPDFNSLIQRVVDALQPTTTRGPSP